MISCGLKSDRILTRRLNILNKRVFFEGKIRPQLIIGIVVVSSPFFLTVQPFGQFQSISSVLIYLSHW